MKYKLVNSNIKSDYGRKLLEERGITNVDLYMSPNKSCLQSWRDLDNIEKGCELVRDTIMSDGKYAIICDSDCDGATSFAILYNYLKKINPKKEIDYYIHSGKQHGLEDMTEVLLNYEYEIIICPDSGTNDNVYAEVLETPILVLDHHIKETETTAANMIIINNQTSPKYKNKDLSGAGVTWQFCNGLDFYFGKSYAYEFIDLAALGIVGDMMSLLELENRYIVSVGLEDIHNRFFEYLIEKQSYSLGNKVTPIGVAFYIVPLINAMIRVGKPEEKARMYRAFIEGKDMVMSNKRGAKGTLTELAIESARECTNAKSLQDKIKENMASKLEIKIHKHDLLENKVLFVRLDDDDDFPSTLTGLIAMQLSSKYKRPTIVARLNEEGYVRGSARGLSKSAMASFKEFLGDTGLFEYTIGHDNAFGASILNSNLSKFHKVANEQLKDIDFGENVYEVNFVRNISDYDLEELIYDLNEYNDTWGQDNPEALVAVTGIPLSNITIMGAKADTVKIYRNGISFIKFRATDFIQDLENRSEGSTLTIVGRCNLNEWNGRTSPQIFIEDYNIENYDCSF